MLKKSTTEIIDDIIHHRADIGLVILDEHLLEKKPSLSYERLLEGRLVVGVSKKSPLALSKSITPEELLLQPIVLYKDDYLKSFAERFESKYGSFNMLFHTNNTVAIQKAVAEGFAATVGLDFSFNLSADTTIVELSLPDQPHVYLGWISNQEKKLPKASQLFINKLKYELNKSQ
ncbi:MAG: LysR family transcriptional regulator substrate-binding protein [Candidatus Pristimantibacillus sp.]